MTYDQSPSILSGANSSLPSPRIPINSCEGLFEKLKWEHKGLKQEWTNSYRAFNFILTAYHLYDDWVPRIGTRRQRQCKGRLPNSAKKLFDTLRDITNASKHFVLNPDSQRKQIVTNVSKPEIRDMYAYLIAGPVPYITVGGALPNLPELASLTIKCLDWILQGNPNIFPLPLDKQLEKIFLPLQREP